jgi:hypothetical protein
MSETIDAAMQAEMRDLVDALDTALAGISPSAQAVLKNIDASDPVAVSRFMTELGKLPAEAQAMIAGADPKRITAGRIGRLHGLAQRHVRAKLPKLTANEFLQQQPVLFRLVAQCLPEALGGQLSKAVVDALTIDDVRIELAKGFEDIYIRYAGRLPSELLKAAGEDTENAPAEIVAKIEVRRAGGDNPARNPRSGLSQGYLQPFPVAGVAPDSKLARYRYTRGLPAAGSQGRKSAVPDAKKAAELLEEIQGRLHAGGLKGEERAAVDHSFARRSRLFRRRKIFPHDDTATLVTKQSLKATLEVLHNDHALDTADLEKAEAAGRFGFGGVARIVDDGRAERFLACIDYCCDDFPGVDLSKKEDVRIEVWRTVLPFYDFHDLYELVDYRGGEVRRSFFLYGDDNRVPYPEYLAPWRLQPLNGQSDPLHLVNNYIGVDVRTPDLAAEYVRFFCSYLVGNDLESGAFDVAEEMGDVRFLADRQRPIDQLYAAEIGLMQQMIQPIVIRQVAEEPPKLKTGEPLEVSDATRALLGQGRVNFVGATVTYDRRLFYVEIVLPAVRLEPGRIGGGRATLLLPITMDHDETLIEGPLPVRVIRYSGHGAAIYSLSAAVETQRQGGGHGNV